MADGSGMKTAIFAALMLLPAGCAAVPDRVTALGYPVVVDYRQNQCRFLIQDMWMSDDAIAERWLAALPVKSDQVDVVWGDDGDHPCIEVAQRAAERAGFTNIVVRQGRAEDYPDLLRQTAQSAVR